MIQHASRGRGAMATALVLALPVLAPTKESGPVNLLDEVSLAVPEFLWLTELLQVEDYVNIRGEATRAAAVDQFIENLRRSPLFKEVVLVERSTVRKPLGQRFHLRFRMPGPTQSLPPPPQPIDREEFLAKVRQAAKESDVTVRSAQPTDWLIRREYVDCKAEGTYEDLARFLDRLNRFTRIIEVRRLQIRDLKTQKRDRSSPTIEATFTLSILTRASDGAP